MSTKKEHEKTPTKTSEDDKNEGIKTGPSLSEQHNAVNRALDETRENIKRSIDNARKEISRNTQAINNYQEQHLQVAQEIADNYLESQREIINSFQSAWAPHFENYYDIFWDNWASPRRAAELYARTVGNFVDNLITATRIGNNAMVAFRTYIQRRKDDSREYSRIGANTAKTYAQTLRGIANDADRSSDSSRNY